MIDDFLAEAIAQDAAALDEDIETAARALDDVDLPFLIERLESLKSQKADLDASLKSVNAALKELEETLLPEKMLTLGLVQGNKGSFTTASGMRVSLRTDVYASVNKAKEPEFFEWLRDTGSGDLIKESVHSQTLRAFVREQRENGVSIPDGLVSTYEVTKAVLTKR